MDLELLERVQMLMARLQIGNTTRFAKLLDMPQSSLEKKMRGVQKFNVSELQKILNTYPQVSSEWLLLGKGDMFLPTVEDDVDALKQKLKEQAEEILKLNETLKKKSEQIDVLLTEKVNLYHKG